jgi:hypothetical protein
MTTLLHAYLRAAALPNPNPTAPPGSEVVTTLLGWVMWLMLTACVAGFITGAGMTAVGNLSERPHVAVRGKSSMLWSVAGAVLIAIGYLVVSTAYRSSR